MNKGESFRGTNAVNARGLRNFLAYLTDGQYRRFVKRGGVEPSQTMNGEEDNIAATCEVDVQIEFYKLCNMYIRRFTWEGLPCPEYFLEKTLLYNGIAVAYVDKELGNIIAPATITKWNYYGEPAVLTAKLMDKTVEVPLDDKAVLLYDSPVFTGTYGFGGIGSGIGFGNAVYSAPYLHFQRAAQILGDLHTTCEVYSWGLKSPMLLFSTSEESKSVKMAAGRKLSNQPYVMLETQRRKKEGKLPPMEIPPELQQLNTPNTAEGLRGIFQHKIAYYNDVIGCYGLGGMAGANKLAQTGEAEVAAGNYSVDTTLKQAVLLREKFAEQISHVFGEKISVVCNVINGYTMREEEEEEEGGAENADNNADK